MANRRDGMLNAENCQPKPGIPGNPLPLWKQLPLDAKLPIPTKVPKAKATYCTTKFGSQVIKGRVANQRPVATIKTGRVAQPITDAF